MGLHYKFYANPLLCHLLILCTCNPHQQCSLIRCCVIYLCIFYKTYSWGFIEHLGMLTRLYLASFLHCTYINFFFWFYVSRWQTELVIPCALCARHICSSFFFYLSHIFYAKHWMHLPIWFQVEFCLSRTFICEPDVVHSFFHYQYFRGFRHENAFVVSTVRALTITFLYTLFCFSFLPYPVSVVGKANDQNNISKI